MKKPEILKAQKYAKEFGAFNLVVGIFGFIILIILKRYGQLGLAALLFANGIGFYAISNLIKKTL